MTARNYQAPNLLCISLGQGPFLLNDSTIKAIAEELHVTAAQVLISWAAQRGTIVIPKSENEERMAANIQVHKSSFKRDSHGHI